MQKRVVKANSVPMVIKARKASLRPTSNHTLQKYSKKGPSSHSNKYSKKQTKEFAEHIEFGIVLTAAMAFFSLWWSELVPMALIFSILIVGGVLHAQLNKEKEPEITKADLHKFYRRQMKIVKEENFVKKIEAPVEEVPAEESPWMNDKTLTMNIEQIKHLQ